MSANLDLAILNAVNILLGRYIEKPYSNQELISLLFRVGKIAMDRLNGTFPDYTYDINAITFYLALRRLYRRRLELLKRKGISL